MPENKNSFKRMLIIHPHWPPSNTVGVHRVRLIANELHRLNWLATVLTIDERDLEEDLSWELNRLVDESVEVIKVRAQPITSILGFRLIGDIGLRGFNALRARAESLLKTHRYDFIWFSLPSWYTPLMGPALKKKYKVPYGVDYRDPWVFKLAPHQRGLTRASLTRLVALVLEPIAVKSASLISGVSPGYIDGVSSRNKSLRNAMKITFQMGFRKEDHSIHLDDFNLPFDPTSKRTYVYAGAYSPNWAPLFHLFLQAIALLEQSNLLQDVRFLFIGTKNPELESISSIAKRLNIEHRIQEIPERIPFLQVQQILRSCQGALVIGSTEPHYSASKLFQCLVTAPRVFGFFHERSEAKRILEECKATQFYVPYKGDSDKKNKELLAKKIASFINPSSDWQPKMQALNKYTSSANAKAFIEAIEIVLNPN